MTASPPLLRIGTRGSALALAQAEEVRRRLAEAHDCFRAGGSVAIEVIKTTGDRITDRALAAIGGKGLFTKEIEQALADGTIDIAVHSMKDVPTVLPDGLVIDCFLPREDPRDAFFSRHAGGLAGLPAGAVVGTASLRRQSQILMARPDVTVVPFRGNVGTRLAKLADGVVDATVLALAGLRRLGDPATPAEILAPETMLPAVAQGVIGIERRAGDERVAAWLAPLNHQDTERCVAAERALLAALDGSCRTPIAALATIAAGRLDLLALVATPDGTRHHTARREGLPEEAEALGAGAGSVLRSIAGPDFFAPDMPDRPAL
jgi:hydroxymethylbilane synthase